MNSAKKLTNVILLFSLFSSLPIFAADILKTDRLYTSQNYSQAIDGYLAAAKVGNPHAYYQLGVIYLKGLGVEKDLLNALIYFSMAAEYKFHDSEKILATLKSGFSDQDIINMEQLLQKNLQTHGKNTITQAYLPEIIEDNLAFKIIFDGEEKLQSKFFSEDFFDDGYSGGNSSADLEEFEESGNLIMLVSKSKPFLIVENEVEVDGSVRNIFELQKFGSSLDLIKEYSAYIGPKPTFKDKPVPFINRMYMGDAILNKFDLIKKDRKLYGNILKKTKELKNSTTLNDKYLYAVTLQNFHWLTQEANEVEKTFLAAAQQGHPAAMYEYGLKLYREQKDLTTAIYWIGEASKYGLARAEFRLGNLLLTSPWVKKDEKKALFWFESAIEKDHVGATLKAIELKLIAEDKSLHDLTTAITLLEKVAPSEINNPTYYYLLALSHRNRENRDYKEVIRNLEWAIRLAESYNWDTTEWQNLLAKLTVGRVYISDDQ